MKKLYTLFIIILCYNASAQLTSIPDPIFEQSLISLNIDSDGILNGQMATADALEVTSLTIVNGDVQDNYIYDLTGIEAFINLEELTVSGTMIYELNVNDLVNLKYLNCAVNMLTGINVTNNVLLEELHIMEYGDVTPMNYITTLDLSNNPNIKKIYATGALETINLKNGNNNPDMYIRIIAAAWYGGAPADYIEGHTCIEIDNPVAAAGNQYPYSEWNIVNHNQSYELVETCTAGTDNFTKGTFEIYPNPATDVINISGDENSIIKKVQLIDMLGKIVKEYSGAGHISLAGLTDGIYFVKIYAGYSIYTQKLIVK